MRCSLCDPAYPRRLPLARCAVVAAPAPGTAWQPRPPLLGCAVVARHARQPAQGARQAPATKLRHATPRPVADRHGRVCMHVWTRARLCHWMDTTKGGCLSHVARCCRHHVGFTLAHQFFPRFAVARGNPLPGVRGAKRGRDQIRQPGALAEPRADPTRNQGLTSGGRLSARLEETQRHVQRAAAPDLARLAVVAPSRAQLPEPPPCGAQPEGHARPAFPRAAFKGPCREQAS